MSKEDQEGVGGRDLQAGAVEEILMLIQTRKRVGFVCWIVEN